MTGFRNPDCGGPVRKRAPNATRYDVPLPPKDSPMWPLHETPPVIRPCSCGRLHDGDCRGRREEGRA